MARIRTIKPEFWVDEKVTELSVWARLLFIGLWNFADDDGRMEFSPKRLKMQIFPADSIDCQALVNELEAQQLVTIYEIEGQRYLQISGFSKHQKIDKRSPSKLPEPPVFDESHQLPPNPPEFPRTPHTEGKGREGNGKEGNSVSIETDAGASHVAKLTKDELWAAGLSLLENALPDKQRRSFIGKLCKDYTDAVALEAIRTAVVERPADPVAYLKAVCGLRSGERKAVLPWYSTDDGIIAKGREMGLTPRPGEAMTDFKSRINDKIAGRVQQPGKVLSIVGEPEKVTAPPEVMKARSEALKAVMKKVTA